MPNTKSAKKRLRQSTEQRDRNRSAKRTIRTQCRKVLELTAEGKLDQAQTEFRQATKLLDQAGAKKVIHTNTAARTKSRLSARLKSAKQKTPATN